MEKYYLAAICMAEQIGCARAKQLLNCFGSAKTIWQLPKDDLMGAKLPTFVIESLVNLRRSNPNCPEKIFEYCSSKKIKICGIKDSDYPPRLAIIPDAPALFYYKGSLMPDVNRIAIVGTRRATRYGENVAMRLGSDIANKGVTVVSGAAIGIDTFAHIGALKTGRTVAVLGAGLDTHFTSDKKRLLDQIIENGAVISEYSPRTPSNKGTFPHRNRIIAGLSHGVVVVEAGDRSGALNTAQHAGNFGRLLFAIPSNLYSEQSRGCHALIRDGAILARNANDILEDCKVQMNSEIIERAATSELPALNAKEQLVYDVIPNDMGISDEEILMKLDDITPVELSSILLSLEMNEYITVDSVGNYIRTY